MKPKFELDGDETACPSARLIDPDPLDASEQQFAASLEQPPGTAKSSFVLDSEAGQGSEKTSSSSPRLTIAESPAGQGPDRSPDQEIDAVANESGPAAPAEAVTARPVEDDTPPASDPESWRNEVAARVNKYRARRRPREPRYPSLQLKFEAYEPIAGNRSTSDVPASPSASRQAISLDSALPVADLVPPLPEHVNPLLPLPETARILEFPRSSFAAMPPRPLDELAEPVFDRPRILEAPEIAPPLPALGGILIEPVEEPATERRPGFEVPLQSAPMSGRLAAAAIDALVVLSALTAFSFVFFWITATVPPLPRAVGTWLGIAGMFWAVYQYLLLVYTGTTPGLKLAKLRLSQFDGEPVPRKIRRWRVLASGLSGLSLGLGYAWCFLDEDELCWHDRITRTYMAPIS